MNKEDLNESIVEDVEDLATQSNNNGKAKWLLIPAGLLSLLILGAGVVWFSGILGSGKAGKAVAEPEDSSFKSDTDEMPEGEMVLTLNPDQLANAGLKYVKVGETLGVESATATSSGVIEANEYEETPVLTQLAGVVTSIRVDLGDYVRRGQVIAVVSSDEFSRVQSDYLKKKAELEEARKRYKRSLELTSVSKESRDDLDRAVAKLNAAEAKLIETKANRDRSVKLEKVGAISKRELEKSIAAYEAARGFRDEEKKRVERSRQLLKINPARRNEFDAFVREVNSKEAELSSLREKLLVLGMSASRVNRLRSPADISSTVTITSPISGSVTKRTVNSGEVVNVNSKLATITDLSTVWAIAQVFEKDLGKLRIGGGAGVSSKAYPGQYFRGNISYIDPELDQSTRTAKVRIILANPNQQFKVGMFVNVAFSEVNGRETTTPSVPESAVQLIGKDSVVFQKTKDPNKFLIKKVETLTKKDGLIPISRGIFVGDEVVSEGSFLLRAEWLKTNSET